MEPQTDPELSGMAEVHSEEARIDHLSRLPPELLSNIFDLAHDPAHPILEPLSKTLLPYFRRNLYRQIKLRNFSSLLKLFGATYGSPSLANMVVDLDLSDVQLNGQGIEVLEAVLHSLPSLDSLKLPRLADFFAEIIDSLASQLPRLSSLSYGTKTLRTQDLATLGPFKKLNSLEVSFVEFTTVSATMIPPSLDNIKTLTLAHVGEPMEHFGPWEAGHARFVDIFSNLTHLTLSALFEPDYAEILACISRCTLSLESLTLKCPVLPTDFDADCDIHFPRFPNLQRLDLCEGTISPDAPVYLRQLPRLEYLRFGHETQHYIDIEALVTLVDGPDRLPSLQVLVIDSLAAKVGRQLDIGDDEESYYLSVEGWEEPDWAHWMPEEFCKLQKTGADNGVEIRGSTVEALEFRQLIELERGNRLILRAHQTKSLDEYLKQQTDPDLNCPLPIINVDKLDLQNLKLVKINLREEGWFQLTLE